ncbi:thymidine kinase (macronuclear) [Tetrahymena thermophila SB210]|uniref:thymidine kinase n=1 Tax=Tetrahymena thermophila (strain SB210) TaxID=312017 RepID=I7M006_TETTS|nr:thymidine kinase [Tetrahymena thermophila SB210]EAR85252.2 thymidine kinase [Tetrahymena thermophila SB210]|eukprot:XP_001032915.2 thymidine kinase [Tetrahymena thermophila SB210]
MQLKQLIINIQIQLMIANMVILMLLSIIKPYLSCQPYVEEWLIIISFIFSRIKYLIQRLVFHNYSYKINQKKLTQSSKKKYIQMSISNKARGFISVYFGPMFSGKSTSLLNDILKYESEQKKVLVVGFAHDNRYSDEAEIVTHQHKKHHAVKCFELKEIEQQYKNYDVIAIDEGQFFLDIADKCDQYANDGKIVIVAALDATFQRKAFNQVLNLIPVAEKVIKLRGKCSSCEEDSSFSSRKIKSNLIELIGGEDLYEPLCRSCFLAKQSKQEELDQEDNSSDGTSGCYQEGQDQVQFAKNPNGENIDNEESNNSTNETISEVAEQIKIKS